MPRLKIAAQLYTVRDLTQKDFAGTCKQVAAIGYRAVELAGYGNVASAKEARTVLADTGLQLSSAHVGLDSLEKDINRALDEQAELGNKNVICPWVGEPRRKSADDWKQIAASLTKIGQACAARGFTFSYHNHSFEFKKFDGKTGMDILWGNTDPKTVRAELDVYWVQHGGEDPLAYTKSLGQRILLLHLKDMARGEEKRFAPVGEGLIDFKSLLSYVETQTQIEYGIVEQDATYETPPLDALRTSFANLKKIGAL